MVNRLSRAEGHVRTIKEMVEANCSCPEVLHQLAAVRGAINQVARIVLSEHLTQCLHQAVDEGDLETEMTAMREALKRFLS